MIGFDLETVPLRDNPEPDPGPPPKNYTDPLKIESWRQDKVASLKSKESLSSSTGRVVLISASVNQGPVVQWYGHDEAMLLADFFSWVKCCDAMPVDPTGRSVESVSHHALAAYNGCRFDFNFLAHRAAVHKQHELAGRAYCPLRYGDRMHIDPWLFYDCKLGTAARSFGHVHPSMDGGSKVGQWWKQRDEASIRQHGIDDIEALNVVLQRGRGFFFPRR